MNPQLFLKNKLQNSSKYELTKEDNIFTENNGIEAFIYKRITSGKFRKWKIQEEAEQRTKKAISIAVNESKSLKVLYPQGAYKLWHLPSSPYSDWAEFFNIAYLVEYVSPIVKFFEPGVEIDYYMHTLIPEKHDNLPTADINSYVESFQVLLDEFSKYFPKNLKIKIYKDINFYSSREEYFEELESHLHEGEADFEAMEVGMKEAFLKMSELNIRWDGIEDWTKLNDDERKEKIRKGAYLEKAMSKLTKPQVFTKADDKVPVFTLSSPRFIGIGSNKSSVTKYWTGYGVLEEKDKNLTDRILSPKQLESLAEVNYKEENVNLIPHKAFDKIRIYESIPNFSSKN